MKIGDIGSQDIAMEVDVTIYRMGNIMVVLNHFSAYLAEIKVFGVLPAYCPMILDAGAVLESLPLLICTDFVYCHCTERRVVFNNNTHGKDSGALR